VLLIHELGEDDKVKFDRVDATKLKTDKVQDTYTFHNSLIR
jgi:hypothetical protein